MIDLLIDLLLASLMLLSIYGIGRTVWRFVPIEAWSASADLALSLASGLGLIATLLFVAGLLQLLIPPIAWAIVLIGGGLALWQWRSLWGEATSILPLLRSALNASWFMRIACLFGLLFLALNLIGDLVPPIEGDTVHQYLLTPREWVRVGRYVQPSNIWASTLPGNMMMISAWALLLRSSFSLATLVTGFGMSLFFALAVYSLARQYFEPIPSLLAAIIAYTMPDVAYLAQSAKVDMGWAFFEVLALAAFFRWLDLTRPLPPDTTQGDRWLFIAGALLGFAAGSKNQTFISVALLGLWLVLRLMLRGDLREMIRSGLIFSAGIVLTGFPYYLYNAVVHHNPLYPIFADLFLQWGGTSSPRSELGTEIFYNWTVGGFLTNLWNMSLGHGPRFYLGFITGPVLLLAIPIGLVFRMLCSQRVAWRMLSYAFVFSIVWFLVKQAARHFMPGLVLLSIVSALILWRLSKLPEWSRRLILIAASLCLLGNFVVWMGVFYWSRPYRVPLGMETREQYLQRLHDQALTEDFPDWATIEYLNTHLSPSDRVLTVHASSPLYVKPQLVPGNWGDRLAYDRITGLNKLLGALEAHQIGYILIYEVDDPATIPLFAQPQFLAAYAELIYDGPRTSLYQLERAGEK